MRCLSLNSGSNGNCVYVEADGVRLLLDAGISAKAAADRLGAQGVDIRRVDAVVISHDHSDHIRGAGVLWRKFGLPIYMTPRTYAAAQAWRGGLGAMDCPRPFRPGEALSFGAVTVETYPTPHDAAEPVVFVVAAGGRRLGVMTDLGCIWPGLEGLLAGLDAAFLESNYDEDMLAAGPYPWFLQQRIRGDRGHLSNHEAAGLVARCAGDRLQWVALSHLSETNNTPDLAYRTHRRLVGARRPIHVASRHGAGEPWAVE